MMLGLSDTKRKFIGDAILNLAACGMPLAVIQLVILPAIARVVDSDTNGLILSLIALFNLLPSTMGNALNNIRLLEGDTEEHKADDDSYRLVLLLSGFVNAAAIIPLTWYYSGGLGLNVILMVVTSTLLLSQEYLVAAYRIDLNYKAVVINAAILSIGYLAGYPLFLLTGEWGFIYCVAQLMSTAYVVATSRLWRGQVKAGPSLRRIVKDYTLLLGSSFLGRAVTYADRLLLYPIMGGFSVSVYYAATLLGKLLSTVITPMNSVMLSYLAKMNDKPKRLFHLVCLTCGVICLAAYVVTIAISKPLLELLYPQFSEEALSLVWVTTAAAYMTVAASILNPFVLKFTSIANQVTVNALYLVLYVSLSLVLLNVFGLQGFCWGTLVASGVKLIALCLFFEKSQ